MRGRAVVDDFNNRRSLRLITAEAAVKIGSRSVQIEGNGTKIMDGRTQPKISKISIDVNSKRK
ncbi:hypothetical protein MTR_7g053070 [Medicago truncatula]|uniref:Uncharacterized protein n=1 Tax=Medicago truncatula TaxID=3880 RepID=G7KZ41_MEDTR|nr:hypothetical protein MTR_7g053070 [Medicago truncatula]